MKVNAGSILDLFDVIEESFFLDEDEIFNGVLLNKSNNFGVIDKIVDEIVDNSRIVKKINTFNLLVENEAHKINLQFKYSNIWSKRDDYYSFRCKVKEYITFIQNDLRFNFDCLDVKINDAYNVKQTWLDYLNSINFDNFADFQKWFGLNTDGVNVFINAFREYSSLNTSLKTAINNLEARSLKNKYLQQILDSFLPQIKGSWNILREKFKLGEELTYNINDDLKKLVLEVNELNEQLSSIFRNVSDVISEFELQESNELEFQDYVIYRLSKYVQTSSAFNKNSNFGSLYIEQDKVDFIIGEIESKLYALTDDQRCAIFDAVKILKNPNPSSCLIQGDVSSGKTIVSVALLFLVAMSGYKCAYVAPRVVLREQHVKTLRKYNDIFGTNLKIFEENECWEGDVDILVCGYSFVGGKKSEINFKFGLIDEIQLFGIEQRNSIQYSNPEINMMYTTATPHPRTKSISLIGDMDVLEIKQLPPGRLPKITKSFIGEITSEMVSVIREQKTLNQLVIVVCPLVEKLGDERFENIFQAIEEYRNIFPDFNMDYIIGKISPAQREKVINSCNDGSLDMLFATTTVEVGLDIKRANAIIIHYPHSKSVKWGMSQLHQLRGRVGRNSKQAYCFIETTQKDSKEKNSPINAVLQTEDVFELTKRDLDYRGLGAIIGISQFGKKGNVEDLINAYSLLAKEVPNIINKLDEKILLRIHEIAQEKFIEKIN